MPPCFGIIYAINPDAGSNQCKGCLISCQVIEDIDESFCIGEVNPDVENINIKNLYFYVSHQ